MTAIPGADPDEVWTLYEVSRDSMDLVRQQVLESIAHRVPLPQPFDAVFPEGTTAGEVREYFQRQQLELERAIVTALVACFEAAVRNDLFSRTQKKAKSPGINRDLQRLWVLQKKRVRLDDIIDSWKQHVSLGETASHFKELMKYRHWLAHGRTWKLSVPATPPAVAWEVAKAFFDQIGIAGL